MLMNTAACLAAVLCFGVVSTGVAFAQTDKAAPAKKDQSSPNFYKTDNFLPGEEVVSPTGQKMKVWTTSGPVPVSRAPQPFDDPHQTQVDKVNVWMGQGGAPGTGQGNTASQTGAAAGGAVSAGAATGAAVSAAATGSRLQTGGDTFDLGRTGASGAGK